MSKEEILENYLNTINLGAGCYGVQAASRRYFGKDVQDLSLGEAAVLAAIPQNPTAYNPILHPEENQQRRQVVLTYMQEQGYITEAEKSEALSTEVYQEISVQNELYEESSVYSYYEDALIHQVLELLMEEKGYSSEQAYRAVFSGGLRIYSSQDSRIQEICDEEYLREENFPEGTEYGIDYALSLQEPDGSVSHYGSEALRAFVQEHFDASFSLLCDSQETARSYTDAFRASLLSGSGEASAPTVLGERLTLSPQPQASLVILEQDTGLVRAVVGGRGEKTASLTLNRATETTRQPGSTFKIPAVYAPALDACGKTLASLYDNEPCAYEDGTPVSNWDLSDYTGPVTIREAITRSINVAAVRCITEITPKLGFSYAVRMGISTLVSSSDLIQPLALGGITQGVTNLELCGAYASIANGGTYLEPLFFTKILDRHGNVVLDCTGETGEPPLQEERRVLKESTAWLLTSAMEDVVAEENGTAYGSIKAASLPVAGKTGTTSSYKDIWFAGYTPYYTCCVWGGYDSNESLESGARAYSKTLWTAIMTRIHESLPQKDFSRPEDIVSVALCSESHLPARKGVCPDTYPEYFVKGTEPEESCGLHLPLRETKAPRLYQDIIGFYDFFKFENVSMRKRFFRRERGVLVTVGRRRDVRAFFRRRVFRQRRAEIFVMLSVLSAYAEISGRDRGRVVFSDIFSVERIVNEIRVVDIAYDTLSFLLYAEARVSVALRSKDIDVVIIRNAFLQLDLIAQKIGIFADRERIFKHCEHILGNAEIHAGHALASHINNVSRGLFHLNHALIDAERVNAVVDLFVLRYLCFKYRSFVRKIGIALFGVFLDSALHIAPGNVLVTREYGYRDVTGQPASQHHCLSVCFVFEGDILRDNVVGRLISV